MSKVAMWKPVKNAFRVVKDKTGPGKVTTRKLAMRRMRRCATYTCSADAEKAARAMNLADPGGSFHVASLDHCIPRSVPT